MARTERQITMLEAMGIRVFESPAIDTAADRAPAREADPSPRDGAASKVPPSSSPSPSQSPSRAAEREVPVATPRAASSGPQPGHSRNVPAGTDPVATLDWPALRDAVAACRACTLCETRKQTVFGVGHHQAHWMIVGEAPGEQEDQKGEPFVGAAGQLLDAMLRAVGLTRGDAPPAQQVYIANTLKCRPPRNRNPSPEELATCEPFLARQIELVQPRVILAMGRFAVQSLLRTDDAIGRLRGRVHTYEGRPLVVTYHPAYLLRNPIDKARSWEDLCLAAEVVEGSSAQLRS